MTGSAEKTLELVTGESTSKTLLANIKNTMSDREIVKKNFNELLEMYRSEILLDVVSSWKNLSSEELQQVSSLNNFFVDCI